jgi:hypothetical protein
MNNLTATFPPTHRLVPSKFPPITLFEHLLDPDELEVAYEIEGLTNSRLRDEAGDISLVPREDRIVGPGSSPVMAAFTHIGYPSRFSDGSFGVYYAGLAIETAIRETVHHRERFLSATNEPPCQVVMRQYVCRVLQPLIDIRAEDHLHHPDTYLPAQQFARSQRQTLAWGLHYRSVRHAKGECVAVFRPNALSPAKQGSHFVYYWDGKAIGSNVARLEAVPA